MMSWWRQSMTGRLLAPVLPALFMAQWLGLALCWEQFVQKTHERDLASLHGRTVAIAQVMASVPANVRSEIARVGGTENTRFWISDARSPSLESWLDEADRQIRLPLEDVLGASAHGGTTAPALLSADTPREALSQGVRWSKASAGQEPLSYGAQYLDYADMRGAGMIVPVGDGQVLNAAYYQAKGPSVWATQLPYTLSIMVVLVSVVTFLTARRLAKPFRELTEAADAVGRGEARPALRERGPDDIRRTAEAFNRMQERLHRFVEDRTRLLAAIGHDLRTPLTTLRLRTDLIEDEDLRQRMQATIEEMRLMTEATLTFAREENVVEETRTVDLSALVESICEDLAELGYRVTFAAAARLPYRCRPDGLRRSIRNLVENALRYAGHADVRLESEGSGVSIVVEDTGPGIPEERFEDVFAPFFRLEESRSRETGGSGLGLSIARAIARQHGGDIVLASGRPGLRASVMLPA